MEFLNMGDKAACAEYEAFVDAHPNGGFTQSLRWTGVKKNWRHEAVLARGKDGRLSGTVLVLIRTIPLLGVSFLYAPHGGDCQIASFRVPFGFG